MSNGYVMLAQNSLHDYVLQACSCAMSIHATNKNAKVSIITNDSVPEKYKQLFDNIIDIPWSDSASTSEWKVENRWKIYHASPYEKTTVLDTDMLVLQDISGWQTFLDQYEFFITNKVFDYRNNQIISDYYRKAFTANNLPNVYVGYHYFRKGDFSKEFYKWMELISNNWELFYGKFVSEKYPKRQSMDVTAALTTKILNCETQITNNNIKHPSFTHMKPMIQGWNKPMEQWQKKVGAYFTDDLKLYIGNHLQSGIFHYTEKDFLKDSIVQKYEKVLGI
jgi:hypothetical protein